MEFLRFRNNYLIRAGFWALMIGIFSVNSLFAAAEPASENGSNSVNIGQAVSSAMSRAVECLSRIKQIEDLITQWEKENGILEAGADRSAFISIDGIMVWNGRNVDLKPDQNKLGKLICPEALNVHGKTFDKPCYKFFLTDNSGQWIKGTTETIGGRGVVCVFEVNGKPLGSLDQPGPDGSQDSIHHY